MDTSALIFQFLNENGSVVLPNFGTFHLQKTTASFDEKSKTILPPAQQIVFSSERQGENISLEQFIAEKRNITLAEAKKELKETIDHWLSKLNFGDTFVLHNFGRLVKVGDDIIFQGEKISENNPDFYGLASINLTAMNSTHSSLEKTQKSGHRWWIVIVLVIILSLITIAILNPSLIFGKKSLL